jgi:hypothetical protein
MLLVSYRRQLRLAPVFILARLNVGWAAVGDWNYKKILQRWQDLFEPALPTDDSQNALRYVLAVLASVAALLLRKAFLFLANTTPITSHGWRLFSPRGTAVFGNRYLRWPFRLSVCGIGSCRHLVVSVLQLVLTSTECLDSSSSAAS